MNVRAIRAIVWRDLARIRGSKAVLLPLIVVPLVMLVVIPLVIGLIPRFFGAVSGIGEVEAFLEALPDAVVATLPEAVEQQLGAAALLYLIAPLYLVVPLMVAIVIAADSFAGERERGTLESLLNAPVTDTELFLAKVASAWLPAVAVSLGGAVVYGIVANLATGANLFPNRLWAALALWVAPGVAAFGLGVTVLVSSRVKGFQEANQLAGVVILPVLLLLVAQASGVLLLSPSLVLVIGAFAWAAAAGVLAVAVRAFNRPALGARL